MWFIESKEYRYRGYWRSNIRANANSIPIAFWLLFEVLFDLSLLQRVQKQVDEYQDISQSNPLCFNMVALCANPLLQSLYAETLGLYASTSMISSPEDRDLNLGEWTIPKGGLLMIPSYVIHRDPIAWSVTNPDQSHPVENFWPERFLTYSTSIDSRSHHGFQNNDTKSPLNFNPSFSLDHLSGCFMPYGGGQGICTGRHFAKYEIITTLALFVTLFDIELVDKSTQGKVLPDLAGFGFGALKPQGSVLVRIKRRNLRWSIYYV